MYSKSEKLLKLFQKKFQYQTQSVYVKENVLLFILYASLRYSSDRNETLESCRGYTPAEVSGILRPNQQTNFHWRVRATGQLE